MTVEIGRDIFAEKIRNWIYGRDKASRIPLIVHQAAQGDFAPFLREAILPSPTDFIADGMYLSVTCAEDTPFIDQEEAKKLNAGIHSAITGYFNKPGRVACGRKVKYRPIFSSLCLPKSLCSFCLATSIR